MGLGLLQTKAQPKSEFLIERPGTAVGRYQLLQKIGEGGFGVVFRAEQVEPVRRQVALKIIKAGMDTKEVIARFEAERQAIAMMDHPNIARVLDAGATETGRPYFVMELVNGIPITDYCDQKNLPTHERLQLFIRVCQAVQHAHQKGVIHRDLKPSNVLVTEHDGEPVPKVIDFGVAKALGQKLTEKTVFTALHHLIGTPAYMSPEQAALSALDIDTRADIYSLGVLLYELLTGGTPFEAETLRRAGLDEVRRMIRETEPPKPSTRLQALGPKLPQVARHRQTEPAALTRLVRGDLDWIVMKCLEKERARRYAAASGVQADLTRYLDNEPVMARPPSKLYRFRKQVQRHKLEYAAAVALGISLLVGMTLSLWQWQRAERYAAENRLRAYVPSIKSAYAALREENSLGAAVQWLEQQIPPVGETNLCGFEWRYLWWLCHSECEKSFPRRDQVLGEIKFSEDSGVVAGYYWDNTLRLWDSQHGDRELLVVTNASSLGGFLEGGESYLVGTLHNGITIRRIPGGAVIQELSLDGDLVCCSRDGSTAITLTAAGELSAWAVPSGKLRIKLPGAVRRRSDSGWTAGITISDDGKFLAVSSASGNQILLENTVTVWQLDTGDSRQVSVPKGVFSQVFAPGGQELAVGAGDGSVLLWEFQKPQSRTLSGNGLPARALAYSPDGTTLAVGEANEHISLWRLGEDKKLPELFDGPIGEIRSLAFSRDGRRLACGGRDAGLKIWRLEGRRDTETVTNVLADEWGNIVFSPDSRRIAAGCKDGTVKVFETDKLNPVASIQDARYVAGFTADGRELLVANGLTEARLCNITTGASRPIPGYAEAQGKLLCVDFDRECKIAAMGFSDGQIQLLDIESGRSLARWLAHPGGVLSLKISPRGDRLYSGGRDKAVAEWDLATRQKLDTGREHKGAVCALATSPNGELIASACGADTIRFWSPLDLRHSIGPSLSFHQSTIRTLAFSNDGRTLVSGADDWTLRFWNVALHQELLSVKMDAPVRLALFSPDGNVLAVVTDRGTLRLLRAPPRQPDRPRPSHP